MHRHTIAGVVAFLALIAPAAASATEPARDAASACRAEKHATGTKVFQQTYAAKSTAKAMAACVGKREAARVNAAKTCKQLKADDPKAFAEQYGTKKNAFGRCVSSTAKAGKGA